MRRHILPIMALTLTLAAPIVPAYSQSDSQTTPPTDSQNANQQMTKEQKKQLKKQEKADRAQAKADKAKRKSLDTDEQKKADKTQDKANREKQRSEQPQ